VAIGTNHTHSIAVFFGRCEFWDDSEKQHAISPLDVQVEGGHKASANLFLAVVTHSELVASLIKSIVTIVP